MINNIKKFLLLALTITVGVSACAAPTLEQQNQQKIIDGLKDTSVVIPSADRGAVSGTISYDFGNTTTKPVETKIQIVRTVDIPKLDANGKPLDVDGKVITSSNQKPALLERANDIIYKETLTNKSMFLISNLRAGGANIIISANSQQSTVPVTIVAGKVIQVPNVILGSSLINNQPVQTNLNISGKVVRADGTPAANAKVSDVTGGFVNVSTQTNSAGEFVLPVNNFTVSKNLEAELGNLTTSISITPEQTENVTIPLIANSRPISGKFIDKVNKKPIAGLQVKVTNTNTSTVTNADGTFILRGVPVTPITLDVGNLTGYINTQINIAGGTTSDELKLETTEVTPLGNLLINLVADNYPDPAFGIGVGLPEPGQVSASLAQQPLVYSCDPLNGKYYLSNQYYNTDSLTGSIQIEGTNIVQSFTYPATPFIDPKPKCPIGTSTETEEKTIYLNNKAISIPVNNLPGGEYTLSVTLTGHQVQKGIRVVIPSKDTISTELIQMRRVKRVIGIGDISGKLILKDGAGNTLSNSLPSGLSYVVAALSGEVDLSNPTVLTDIFTNTDSPLVSGTTVGNKSGSYVNGDGTFSLKNIPTGTKLLVAGIVNGSDLDTNYLPSSYVSLNVVSSRVNIAPDILLYRR